MDSLMPQEESRLYARYNTDDVFNRVVIVGLLDLMNKKIKYEQIWETNIVEVVEVPCMYDFGSSDERFAQDNYTFFGEACFGGHKITGKFDMLPRCILRYSGSQIDASNITNRFVNGKFVRNENGRLVTYHSFLYTIPITFNFEATVFCDNIDTAFKIEQSLRETFYKNKTYNVIYKGMRLSCCAGFPETVNIDRTVSYSFDAERDIKMTFSLAVEAYQPVFDETTKMDAANRIEHIGFDVEHFPMSKKVENDGTVRFKELEAGVVHPEGSVIHIEWDSSCSISDMPSLCLTYSVGGGPEHLICSENHGWFDWVVPDGISGFIHPKITFMDFRDDFYMLEEPVIRVVPNSNGKVVENSFVVVYGGRFAHDGDSVSVPVTIDYVLDDGKVRFSDSYSVNIVNGKVDELKPVTLSGDAMTMENIPKPVPVTLKLTYPTERKVFDVIDNVLVL